MHNVSYNLIYWNKAYYIQIWIFVLKTRSSSYNYFPNPFVSGFGNSVLLSGNPNKFEKLSVGQKLKHAGMSLLLTLTVGNIKISSTSAICYAVRFLKLTTMMIGVVYIIPQLLHRNKRGINMMNAFFFTNEYLCN